MSKILIENEKVITSEDIEYSYKEKQNIFEISEITIDIKRDQEISFKINLLEETKLVINFNLHKNVKLDLSIITTGVMSKIQYKYNLSENSNCHVEKINMVDGIREMIIANLDEMSNIDYHFKSIASNKENYDYMIYHNGINSTSNIINNGVNECGSIYLQISSFVPKNIIGCSTNQYNKIINNTENKCEIRPNLYIDCSDVSANHSALIDKFSNEEIFYLESKGIKYEDATKLLTRGFLLSKITNKEIIDIINKRYGGE